MLSDHSFHCISRWSIDPKICQIKMGFHTRQTAFFAFKLYKRQIFLGYNFWKANFILRNSTIHSYQIIGFHVLHTIQRNKFLHNTIYPPKKLYPMKFRLFKADSFCKQNEN